MARNLHCIELKSGGILIFDLSEHDSRLYFRDNRLCLYNGFSRSGPRETPDQEEIISIRGIKVRRSDFPVTVFEEDFCDYGMRSSDIVSISPYRTSPDGKLIH